MSNDKSEPTIEWEYRNISCRVYQLGEFKLLGFVRVGDEWTQVTEVEDVSADVTGQVEGAVDSIIRDAVRDQSQQHDWPFGNPSPIPEVDPEPIPDPNPNPDPYPGDPEIPKPGPYWCSHESHLHTDSSPTYVDEE